MTATASLILPDQYRAEVQYRKAVITGFQPEERIIEMTAVPYGVEARLGPRLYESFLPKAFARSARDPGRVTLYDKHSDVGGNAVGRAMEVQDRPEGVLIRARVSNTSAGNDLLTLAKDGVLGEASVEFQPIEEDMKVTQRGDDILVQHRRAHLLGVALVPHGAYGKDAPVTSVRDALSDKAREEWLARLRCRTA